LVEQKLRAVKGKTMWTKRLVVYIVTIALLSSSGRAREQITYALFPFECPKEDRVAKELASDIQSLLFANLSSSRGICLVERTQLNLVLEEFGLALGWQTSPDETLKIGKLVGADLALVGSMFCGDEKHFLIAKVVDLHTAVIRDISILSVDGKELDRETSALTEFILRANRQERAKDQRVFLGIGGFEDLSVNSRYENLGQQVRDFLQQSFVGSTTTVLERALVGPVLNELTLKRAGLIENSDTKSSALPAFVLVDGIYQSFREERTQISMVLRIQKVGGPRRTVTIEAEPGESLSKQILFAIECALKEGLDTRLNASREAESRIQLELGKERSRLTYMNTSYPRLGGRLGGYLPSEEKQKRLQNIKEAIQAFESAVLLDPECYEAQLMLGICLCDRDVADYERGRNLFRMVIAGAKDQRLKSIAKFRLGTSYMAQAGGEEDENRRIACQQRAFDLLAALLQEIRSPDHRSWVLDHMESLYKALHHAGRRTLEERLEFQRSRIFNGCELAQQRARQGLYINVYGLSDCYFNRTSHILQADKTATASHFVHIIKEVEREHPHLVPYFVVTYVTHQEPDPNRIELLRNSVKRVREHPEFVVDYHSYCRDSLRRLLGWATKYGEYELSILAGEMVLKAVDRGMTMAPLDQDHVKTSLGYAYMQQGQWKKALERFESVKGGDIPMRWSGPWGREGTAVVIKDAMESCKQNLGDAVSGYKPSTFLAGKPLLRIGKSGAFDVKNDRIWFPKDNLLYFYDLPEQVQVKVDLDQRVESKISCLAIGDRNIWFGTAGGGLYAYDPIANKTRCYTAEDGLPLENITCLQYATDRLWIGFGKGSKGAIGYLEIENQVFVGLMPKLDPSVESAPHYGTLSLDPSDAAPKHWVSGLVQSDPLNLWVAVRGKGLQHYSLSNYHWDTATASHGFNREPVRAITDNRNQVSCITGGPDMIVVGCANESRGRSGYDYRIGGIAIYETVNNNWKSITTSDGLPKQNICSLTMDGNSFWAGGKGFIALVDAELNRVESVFTLGDEDAAVKTIRVAGKDVLFSAGDYLYVLDK
jgi:tetratricopeptide (TPR) repeat protein